MTVKKKEQKQPRKKPDYKTTAKAIVSESYKEINTDPSKTVPNEAMSVKEIMERYASGKPLPQTAEPLFRDEDGDEINWETLDISEQQEILLQAEEFIKRVKEDVERQKVRGTKIAELEEREKKLALEKEEYEARKKEWEKEQKIENKNE